MRKSPISNQQSSSWLKRKRNIIKELLQTSKLITSTANSCTTKMIWKEHGKKLCKYQYHIDNRTTIYENFNELFSALIKSLKINFFIAWEVHEMLSLKMRNLKELNNNIFQSSAFRSSYLLQECFWKFRKIHVKTPALGLFVKVAILILLKIDSSTGVFL